MSVPDLERQATRTYDANGFRVSIWDHLWTAVAPGRITVAHFSYPDQRHQMDDYEIRTAQAIVGFAAGELSNDVWGVFIPDAEATKRSTRDSETPRSRQERRPSEAPLPWRNQEPRRTYGQAFPALVGIYLEDSWGLDVQADAGRPVFRLDAVLAPDHPVYRPLVPGQHHCYRTGHLVIHSPVPVALERSTGRPARDATAELDFGNIDAFVLDDDGGSTWRLAGGWGTAVVTDPDVALHLEN
jgi:hypothetical protein